MQTRNSSGQLRPTMLCRQCTFYWFQNPKATLLTKTQDSGTHGKGLISLHWRHVGTRNVMPSSSDTESCGCAQLPELASQPSFLSGMRI